MSDRYWSDERACWVERGAWPKESNPRSILAQGTQTPRPALLAVPESNNRLDHARTHIATAHDVTRAFEAALCEYTGARFAVTTTSCTQAILMALAWWRTQTHFDTIKMPRLSYVGVPAAVRNAGFKVGFFDEDWQGEYKFYGAPVYDSARRFTSDMCLGSHAMRCVSFHWGKILGLSQGGAILHDDPEADAWLRRARFDGRTEGADPKTDQVQYPSWHAYLSPEVAAHGLMKLSLLPRHNADLPRSDYPDLSTLEAFR